MESFTTQIPLARAAQSSVISSAPSLSDRTAAMVSEEAAQYACESQNLIIYWKNFDLLAQPLTPAAPADAQPEREHPGEASPQNKTTLAGARR